MHKKKKKNEKTNTEVRVFTSLVHSQEQPLPALQSSRCSSLADSACFVPYAVNAKG